MRVYWRSKSGFKVDFILDHEIAVGVKAKEKVSMKDLKGIKALQEENLMKQYFVVTNEQTARTMQNIKLNSI